jgi:hypothetical protein
MADRFKRRVIAVIMITICMVCFFVLIYSVVLLSPWAPRPSTNPANGTSLDLVSAHTDFVNTSGLSGLALLLSASVASVNVLISYHIAMTLHKWQKQQQEFRGTEEWYRYNCEIYDSFYNDSDIVQVRAWIANDSEYDDLLGTLSARLDGNGNANLTADDYKKLEKLDKFCSLLVRIIHLHNYRISEEQRVILGRIYYNYWVSNLSSREKMSQYINKFWPELLNDAKRVMVRPNST